MDTSHDSPSGANSSPVVPPASAGAAGPPKIAPALLFILVCLAIVRRERPDWVSDVTVARVAESLGVDPTYVSRTAARFYGPARALLDALTRRGRRPSDGDDPRARELRKLKAQLDVARAMLRAVPRHAARIREIAVGSYARLRALMTRVEFCSALGISERTFRQWCRHPPAHAARPDIAPAVTPPKPKAKPKRALRRPRFDFDVHLPGVQLGGDTTALRVFNTDLKLVASQDIGGRGLELFNKTVIDTTETAAHVIEAFTAALQGCPGMQVVTDQGSPFMAADTVDALEKLGAEHAPQKEGDPCGKATVERGFGVLKDLLQPLLDVTNGLAARIPVLAHQAIAIATARLFTTVVLRAYQAGARANARASDATGGMSPDKLVAAAAKARDNARADERSVRLFLETMHAQLHLPGSQEAFVRLFRRAPLCVLKSAALAISRRFQILGEEVREPVRYFAAIVRTELAAFRTQRAAAAKSAALNDRLRRQHDEHAALERARRDDPVRWLRDGLDMLRAQWLPDTCQLLFGGVGLGLANVQRALGAIAARIGVTAASDAARVVLDDFRTTHPDLHVAGFEAIAAIVERALASLPRDHEPPPALAHHAASAIPSAAREEPPGNLTI